MGAVSDLSDLVAKLTGGNNGNPDRFMTAIFDRLGSGAAAATVAGRTKSLWQNNKSASGQGAAPGSVVAPTKSTTGALWFVNASGGRQRRLCGLTVGGNQAGTLTLYDRLLHISGLSGTVTSAQTVGGSLSRNTGGVGNQIWVEIYGQIGATATTIKASYSDESGNAGVDTPLAVFGGTGAREAQTMIQLPLADGDFGVRAVASVTVTATTGTAGDFGVTVLRPICQVFVPQGGFGQAADLLTEFPSLPPLDDDSCLALHWTAVGTTAPQVTVQTSTIEA